ncbi:hypothetical protein [Lapillicoccus jejuensis]|uniref:hypothetical protein n=1 Tax=Lapillicoccus jejuensis TaxID=402171 RepID=UPI0011510C7E|nr:hypothetical protein [Lapillicoccus jejuensis]
MQLVCTRSGSPLALRYGDLDLLQLPASELEDGLVRLVLRVRGVGRDGTPTGERRLVPLVGQHAPARVVPGPHGPVAAGTDGGLSFRAVLRPAVAVAGWVWHVEVTNVGDETVEVDVVHTHDVALAPHGAVRSSEAYVSQYLDLTPVAVPGHGTAVAVRQNMPGERQPWALLGGLGRVVAWSTDARQLAGDGAGGLPGLAHDLPSTRLQHEHTLVGLQSEAVRLAPGDRTRTGFFGLVRDDHAQASGPADADRARVVLDDPAAALVELDEPGDLDEGVGGAVVRSAFTLADDLACRVLGDDELVTLTGVPRERWAQVETGPDGALWSAFLEDGAHLVTAAKESAVLRPHGHVLRTGSHLVPDERGVTSTVWLAGGFAGQVTQGHVALGSVLSLRRTHLGLQQASGLRILLREDGRGDEPSSWRLLGRPSAWVVEPGRCRWFYAVEQAPGRPGPVVEVATTAPTDRHELEVDVVVHGGASYVVRAALHVALGGDDGATPVDLPVEHRVGGLVVRPPAGSDTAARYPGGRVELAWTGAVEVGDDGTLLEDGRSVGLPWVTLTTAPTDRWRLTLRPHLVADDAAADDLTHAQDLPAGPQTGDAWARRAAALVLDPPAGEAGEEVTRLQRVLPWFAHDALVHYLSPRGLEQYTGGGWGTRDVCQGPVGLLAGLGEADALVDVARRVLAAQNARGDWPQAFDFLARHKSFGQWDSHGDVVYWPLLALADVLEVTGERALLRERLPFTGDGGWTEPAEVLEHVRRALDLVEGTFVPGTHLPRYGHGDWNDSLQPVDADLARHLVSTWTVVLQAQALLALEAALLDRGHESDPPVLALAARCREVADAGVRDLRTHLAPDGVLAGYGVFDDDGRLQGHLVHPRDTRTGLTYSVLPMIHAVTGDVLTAGEARRHLALVAKHLTGPDGTRLFDRPVAYRGGPMEVFQRAEASTFFGREIGIMYTHAHLRHAEALARVGDGAGLLRGLALANPVGVTDRVPSARPRQATTYFSSSDAAFADRTEADRGYAGVLDGTVPLEGGWRVYSSGPGLVMRLVTETLLGVRRRGSVVELDPVLDPGLDGLRATVTLLGRRWRVSYAVAGRGYGVTRVSFSPGARAEPAELATRALENPHRTPGVAVDVDVLTAAVAAAPPPGPGDRADPSDPDDLPHLHVETS